MTQPLHNDMKSKGGFSRVSKAFFYSRDGLIAAFVHEAAFRQLLALHSILLITVWFFDFGTTTRMILIAASMLSLIIELLNSAIEAVVDYISLERHPLAKRAKDLGSAAQMLMLTLLGALWLLALFG